MSALSDSTQVLIWSFEHRGWWRACNRGYTDLRSRAGRYSLAEAVEICREANKHKDDDQKPEEVIVPLDDREGVA